MDGELFLVLIDLIEKYGLQALGIIVVILISKPIVIGLFWVLYFFIGTAIIVIKILLFILLLIIKSMPKAIHNKLDKFTYQIENVDRKVAEFNKNLKLWFQRAPTRYSAIHEHLIRGIKYAGLFAIAIYGVVFIVNVFIQKTLTVEQILNYI